MASNAATRFVLIFHVPPSALQACKAAVFKAGAGCYPGPGNYTECCWSTKGIGQFRPGETANPHLGKVGELEETPEVCVETLCTSEEIARAAVAALKRFQAFLPVRSSWYESAFSTDFHTISSAHPYEEPAYRVVKLEDF